MSVWVPRRAGVQTESLRFRLNLWFCYPCTFEQVPQIANSLVLPPSCASFSWPTLAKFVFGAFLPQFLVSVLRIFHSIAQEGWANNRSDHHFIAAFANHHSPSLDWSSLLGLSRLVPVLSGQIQKQRPLKGVGSDLLTLTRTGSAGHRSGTFRGWIWWRGKCLEEHKRPFLRCSSLAHPRLTHLQSDVCWSTNLLCPSPLTNPPSNAWPQEVAPDCHCVEPKRKLSGVDYVRLRVPLNWDRPEEAQRRQSRRTIAAKGLSMHLDRHPS